MHFVHIMRVVHIIRMHIMPDGLVFFDKLVDTFHFYFDAYDIRLHEREKNGGSLIDEISHLHRVSIMSSKQNKTNLDDTRNVDE